MKKKELRDRVVYARVTQDMGDWLKSTAQKEGCTVSALIDYYIYKAWEKEQLQREENTKGDIS